MSTELVGGHDGPYDAPVDTGLQTVLPSWIDYNGHMNVAYYTLAMDEAMDRFLQDTLGIGEDFAKSARMGPFSLQANYHYFDEMREGEGFRVQVQLLDHDAKRMHLHVWMIRDGDGQKVASVETVLMNVDHDARRSAPYPQAAVARLGMLKAAHDRLAVPDTVGAKIGLRRSRGT